METQLININQIDQNKGQIEGLPANPRQWTRDDVERLARSIEETPELLDARPLIAIPHGGKYIVLGGNLRLAALKRLGRKEAPVYVLPEDTPSDKLREIVVKDNGAFGSWDFDMLANEWDDLPLLDWGVPSWDTETKEEKEVKEDDFDEMKDEIHVRCQPGDVWQLGDHRLMCGDSSKKDDVATLMDGRKADISFTSPPYGVNLDYNEYQDSFANTKKLVESVLPIMADNTDDYVVLNWGDIVSGKDINKTKQPSMFSWLPVYLDILLRKGWYLWAERIWKKPHARCSGIWSASSNRPVSDWEFIFTFANHQPKYNERANGSHFGVIDSSDDSQSDTLSQHPGAFPIFVPSKVIQTHSAEGASVLDLFGGTGTTLIAAEQLGRKCYMMELDPHYCDVIVARWEKLTGREAIKY